MKKLIITIDRYINSYEWYVVLINTNYDSSYKRFRWNKFFNHSENDYKRIDKFFTIDILDLKYCLLNHKNNIIKDDKNLGDNLVITSMILKRIQHGNNPIEIIEYGERLF